MRLLRFALAIGVVAAAVYAVRVMAWQSFECNRAEKQAELTTAWADDHSTSLEGVRVARQTIERMQRCIGSCPTSIDAYMVSAADYRIIGRSAEAISLYQAALKYDRRPEIYFELGTTFLEIGQRERATATLFIWNLFYGQHTEGIPDLGVRADVEAQTKRFFAAGRSAQLPAALR